MKICDECETVAHCTKHGCIPKVSSKDLAMRLALEALEIGKRYARTLMMNQEPFDAAINALAEQPAQQETSNESAYQRGYLDGMAKPCVECADRKLKEMAKHPSVQQEADLSGLKPATQEVVKGWIADGTFIKRAIGAMQEQEAENMRLEKMAAPQPAQQEPVTQWQKRHPMRTKGLWQNTDEHDAKWWRDNSQGWEIRPLYKSPPAQQEPVPEAMKIVIEAMRADPDYAWIWHCNIAMAFVDAGGDHYTGNQGAARFMKMLANVAPAHELPSPPAKRNQLSVDEIFEAIRPLYSSDKAAWLAVNHSKDEYRAIEAKHGIKENT